jgi:hypothetical protein
VPKGIGTGLSGIIFLLSMLLTACGGSDSPVIASYKNEQLTRKQLDAMIPAWVKGADSVRYAEGIIDQWIRDAAMCDAALTQDPTLSEQVEWKVEDTKRKLIIHLYTSRLISDSLKSGIPEKDIQGWYEQNSDKYISKQNLYSYLFISTEALETGEIANLLMEGDASKMGAMRQWAREKAVDFKLDSTFLEENFINELNKGYFGVLKNTSPGKFIRWETVILGKTRKYLFKMIDKVEEGERMPLALVRDDIRDMLLTERKSELINNAEDRILQNSKQHVRR